MFLKQKVKLIVVVVIVNIIDNFCSGVKQEPISKVLVSKWILLRKYC